MDKDLIRELSQDNILSKKEFKTPVLFPEIPDPPEGFDPEANILFKDDVPHSERAIPKTKKNGEMLPRARVFLIGPEGNPEYEEILRLGLEGRYVLGKKDVTDLRGSDKFKVYLEWIELPESKS